ncbi:MAG: hypothetical protein AAF458_10665 [Pseudomonadota bacterium]
MASDTDGMREIRMDADNLYIEEMITDMAAGSIRRLTPINADGSADTTRPIVFMGQAQVLSAMGPLPLTFALEAEDLAGAVEMFADAAEEAVKKMVEELKEMQRQQASQIVVPGAGGAPPMPGAPGGGRFQLR